MERARAETGATVPSGRRATENAPMRANVLRMNDCPTVRERGMEVNNESTKMVMVNRKNVLHRCRHPPHLAPLTSFTRGGFARIVRFRGAGIRGVRPRLPRG